MPVKLLHMVCRRLPHLLGDMPVHIQREARRRVAEVCLYGFDVVAAFNGDYGVAVPQIVKAQPVQPDLTDNILEVVVDSEVAQVRAELVDEHQVPPIVPRHIRDLLTMLLQPLFLLQKPHDGIRNSHNTASAVLGRHEGILAADLVRLLKLLVDVERVALEVHAVPGEAEDLALP